MNLQNICYDVEREWGMGGLSDGLYGDYAKEVARRAVSAENAKLREQPIPVAVLDQLARQEEEIAKLREMILTQKDTLAKLRDQRDRLVSTLRKCESLMAVCWKDDLEEIVEARAILAEIGEGK